VRKLVIWDHTVLPATQQRWFSRLYPRQWPPAYCRYSFIDSGRRKCADSSAVQ